MSHQLYPLDPAISSHGPVPTHRAPTRVVVTMALAQFGLFVALLAPVTVSLALKTQTLSAATPARPPCNGEILSIAAFFALVANPVFGRLSDLTTSRFGRRRTWMVIGLVFFVDRPADGGARADRAASWLSAGASRRSPATPSWLRCWPPSPTRSRTNSAGSSRPTSA